MLYTCYIHVIYMLYTCYIHVIYMLYTCYIHVQEDNYSKINLAVKLDLVAEPYYLIHLFHFLFVRSVTQVEALHFIFTNFTDAIVVKNIEQIF